jgi:hypothetical protein
MASPAIIVTATDSRLFWLAKGLVLSTAAARAQQGHAMVCYDLGLAPAQAAWMEAQGLRVLPPEDPLDAARLEGFQPYMLGQLCRPFLPRLLPGHDIHVWLDADTWVQEADGLGGLLHVARYGNLACCPEVHVLYSNAKLDAPRHRRYWQREWTAAFGADVAATHAPAAMINSGVFAAKATHPIWAAWEAELRVAITRPLTHLSEQLAFCKAALGCPQVERLPAQWNWLANFAFPRWFDRESRWIEPAYPHQRIRILHLAGAAVRPRYLAKGLLFDRGAYLEPGEAPAS